MKKFKKLSAIFLAMTFLATFVPQEAYAGKHKDQYGHSWLKCAWSDLTIKVFGVTIKEGENLH
ncbi:MAG: hypothetical protein ACPG8F_07760 [Flavobacteriaceae bacterium]